MKLVAPYRTSTSATRGARALLVDFAAMPYRARNLTRWILLEPAARELYVDWAQIASEMVAILRLDAGAHPDDPRTTELVGELTLKSLEFSRWWSQHKVLDRSWGHKRFRHAVVGPLEIDYEAFHLPGDPDQTLFVYRAPSARPMCCAWPLLESDRETRS